MDSTTNADDCAVDVFVVVVFVATAFLLTRKSFVHARRHTHRLSAIFALDILS